MSLVYLLYFKQPIKPLGWSKLKLIDFMLWFDLIGIRKLDQSFKQVLH